MPGEGAFGQLVSCLTAQSFGTASATLPKGSVFQPEGIGTADVVEGAVVELPQAARGKAIAARAIPKWVPRLAKNILWTCTANTATEVGVQCDPDRRAIGAKPPR